MEGHDEAGLFGKEYALMAVWATGPVRKQRASTETGCGIAAVAPCGQATALAPAVGRAVGAGSGVFDDDEAVAVA